MAARDIGSEQTPLVHQCAFEVVWDGPEPPEVTPDIGEEGAEGDRSTCKRETL